MKMKLFNQKQLGKAGLIAPDDKRIVKSDAALDRAQVILDEMKINMEKFGSELDLAVAQSQK